MSLLTQSALIVFIVSFALAFSSLSKNFRNKLVLYFVGLCAVISFWSLFFVLAKIYNQSSYYKIHLFFNLLLAPVGLRFLKELTGIRSKLVNILYWTSLGYTFLISCFLFLGSPLNQKFSLIGILINFGPGTLTFGILYTVLRLLLKQNYLFGSNTFYSKLWVYLGAVFLLSFAVMDHVSFLGEVIPSIGNIVLSIYLFVLSEVVVYQRLLNFRALYNQILLSLLMSLIFAGLYVLLTYWVRFSFLLYILNSIFTSFIIVQLIDPSKSLLLRFLKIFSSKSNLEYEKKLQNYIQNLTGVTEVSALSEQILSFVQEMLKCDLATFFLLRADESSFRRYRGFQDQEIKAREVLVTQPLFDYLIKLRKKGEMAVAFSEQLELEQKRSTSRQIKSELQTILDSLSALQANLVIPFFHDELKHKILGFISVRVPKIPEPLFESWGAILAVLEPYFEKCALVLKNMEVYVRVREKDRLAALGEMSAGLAHEIRNPLGAIKGAVQYLQTHHEGELKEDPFLKVIVDEVNRLNKVVTQFLDYSKQTKIEKNEVNIKEVLEKTLASFKASYLDLVEIQFEVQPTSNQNDFLVYGSQEQLQQVFVNLIQNSIQAIQRKFSSNYDEDSKKNIMQSNGKILVQLLKQDAEVLVKIIDNGVGIEPSNLDKIFIPFYTTTKQGTGLGLAISAKIIENHGGSIEVESGEGETVFTVRLYVIKR
jgi:signal transduction histidine kinase